MQHTEEIAQVGAVRLAEFEGSDVMTIDVVTSGKVRKTLVLNEESARWLVASIRDRKEWFASED